MKFDIPATIIMFAVLLLMLVLPILLEIFLARRESPIPGLILPAITFLFALFSGLGIVLYSVVPSDGSAAGVAGGAVVAFLIQNIPTAVLLAIYFACREKQRKQKQIDRMNIQDL